MLQFPYELNQAIKGLNNEHRQKIMMSLIGSEKLSFSEIGERTGIERTLLANHLKTLSNTLLIEHYYEHEIGNEKFSYYHISPFAKALLENMMGTLYAKHEKVTMRLFLEYEKETTTTESSPLNRLRLSGKSRLAVASSQQNIEDKLKKIIRGEQIE